MSTQEPSLKQKKERAYEIQIEIKKIKLVHSKEKLDLELKHTEQLEVLSKELNSLGIDIGDQAKKEKTTTGAHEKTA